jgi:DNA polymerase III epsilon subunit-like protein
MYLLFDFETTGVGKPITSQRAIQLSWLLCNNNLEKIYTKNYYINNISELNTDFHKNISINFLNKVGKDIKEVLELFIKDLNKIVENRGKIIAHNIAFDMKILENECKISGINIDTEQYTNFLYCTMKNSVQVCKLESKTHAGENKYPKLIELYQHFYKKDPEIQLHNSLNDVEILWRCYKELDKSNK